MILKDAVYVPLIRRNLISILALDKCGYSFVFGNGKVDFYFNSSIVGSVTLRDGLYMLNLNDMYVNSVVGTKCNRKDKSSSIL